MFDIFAQDDRKHSFILYFYAQDYGQLAVRLFKDEKLYYVGFIDTIYYSGTTAWEGRNFYCAPRTELEALVNQNAHLNEYMDDVKEGLYDLFISHSENDRVMIIAHNCSISENNPLKR